MTNNIAFYMIAVMIGACILYRININKHKKNRDKFLSELKEKDSKDNKDNKDNKEITTIIKSINNHYEILENSQLGYVLVIILAMGLMYIYG
nr:hypothetical protein [Tissierella sp.]